MPRPSPRFCRSLLLLILGGIWASGCSQAAPVPPPPAAAAPSAAPSTVNGGWSGRIPGALELWPDRTVLVYAVPYTSSSGDQGFYLLDTATSPKAVLDAGSAFVIENAPPGQYLLAVGPDPAEARLAVDAQGQKRIIVCASGVIQPLGELDLGQ